MEQGNTKKRQKNRPLERSSYEFIVALLMASIVQLIPGWIAYFVCWIVLAGIAIYFCLFSPATIGYGPWRKTFLSVSCFVFLFSISYKQTVSRYREENIIPVETSYMTEWGGIPGSGQLVLTGSPPRVVSGVPSAAATVDGRQLYKYKDKFNLMVVILHIINGESYMDKTGLSKSRIERIRNEDMTFKIDFNIQFLQEMEMGANGEEFILLAVPRRMTTNDFESLNDAEDRGAQIIGKGGAAAGRMTNSSEPAKQP